MNKLEARVAAANSAGLMANEYHPKLVGVLRNFIGKKIVTQHNELTAEVKKAIAEVLGDSRGISLSEYKSYSLAWNIKTCVSSEHGAYQHANYHEICMLIGSVRDHILTEVHEQKENYVTNYSAQKIINARREYESALMKAEQLLGELYPFGEYDK